MSLDVSGPPKWTLKGKNHLINISVSIMEPSSRVHKYIKLKSRLNVTRKTVVSHYYSQVLFSSTLLFENFYLDPLTIKHCGAFMVIGRHEVNNMGEETSSHKAYLPLGAPRCALPSHFSLHSVSICIFKILPPEISKHT